MTNPVRSPRSLPPLRLDPEQPVDLALAELQAQLEGFGEAFPFGTWTCDPEGRATHFSRSFLELVGMTLEEAAGFGWSACLAAEEAEDVVAAWRSAVASGAGWSREQRIRDRDGAYHTILSRGVPIHGPDGAVLAWAGINLDLTDRAEAEIRLRESEDRFRTATAQMLDPFGIYRAVRDDAGEIVDFEVLFVNQAAIEANRLPVEEQAGRRLGDLLPAHHRLGLLEEYVRVVEAREPLVLEDFEYTDAYGGEELRRVFDIRVAPLGDGFSATWRDVTERRERERALREANERYELVARATNDVIWDWDLHTGEVRWNEALQRVMGYEPSEIRHAAPWWTDRIHPEDRSRIREGIEQAVAGAAERWTGEYRFRRADGEWAVVLDRGYITCDEDGRPARMIGSMLDVTDQRVAERERIELLRREQAALEQARTALEARADLQEEVGAAREREVLERSRLRAVLDVLPVGVWIADADGRILEGNAAGLAIWGEDVRLSERPDDYGTDFQAWWPDGTPLTSESWGLARALRDGTETGPEEIRIRTADGEEKHILNYAVPIVDPAGAIVGGVAVNVDLTEKKEAEGVIMRQLAELDLLYRSAPIGLCVFDEELRFVRVNERMAEMNGVAAHDHLGKTPREVVPGLADFAEPRFREILRTGQPVMGIEVTGETPAKPGVVRTWIEHWMPLRDVNGGIRGISVVAEEVTEQKAAERALQRNERRQRLLARAGELFSRPMTVEDRLEALAGLATAELCDLCVIDLLEDDGEIRRAVVLHRDPTEQERADALRQWAPGPEGPQPNHSRHRGKGGEPGSGSHRRAPPGRTRGPGPPRRRASAQPPASALLLPLVARDRAFGAVSLVSLSSEDLYDQEGLELTGEVVERAALSIDNARLYEQMERAVRDREEVLSVVSHDLRNPLNSIGMAASLILEEDLREEKRLEQARVIRNAFIQALRLMEDLLDVSRVQPGVLSLETGDESPSSLIEVAVAMAAGAADQKGVMLKGQPDSTLPPVRLDRQRILQVLGNLIGNAIRHTTDGGSVEVSATARGERVRFEVVDTGSGIDPGDLGRVFDRFWRGRATSESGAGLGLVIAKGIIESHGGEIGAASEPGKGSCFWFEIPVGGAG